MKYQFISLIIFMILFNCKEEKKNPVIPIKITKEKKAEETTLNVIGWRSHIAWRANKILESHSGKIVVDSGQIHMNGDQIVSGRFNIDLTTLMVTDLKGDKKEELESLLKGKTKEKAFFKTDEYPNATFEIIDSYLLNDTRYISGDLTINGITQTVDDFVVEFEAFKEDKSKIWLTSKNFKINRLKWGLNYGSKTIEKDLVDELIIRDEIQVRIKILFNK